MHSPYFRVSFIHESTTLFASSQFASPVSFNLSQLVSAAQNSFFACTPEATTNNIAALNLMRGEPGSKQNFDFKTESSPAWPHH